MTEPTATSTPHTAAQPQTMLTWQTFAFLTVASLVSIAQLPAAAEYGLGATTLYLLPALLFLIPVALVSAELAMVRRSPFPFPPEPLRWAGVTLTRRAIQRSDDREGRRGPWLRMLDRFGIGFDS